jgi:hypothetical protein
VDEKQKRFLLSMGYKAGSMASVDADAKKQKKEKKDCYVDKQELLQLHKIFFQNQKKQES